MKGEGEMEGRWKGVMLKRVSAGQVGDRLVRDGVWKVCHRSR